MKIKFYKLINKEQFKTVTIKIQKYLLDFFEFSEAEQEKILSKRFNK